MATLDKLKICGIRSFGCEEEDVQTVRFHKPLTLILGENGCGKSTIIECLRYLTAQKEPSGKGTFVHDPSLTNKATVKGFVKLRMLDVKGTIVDLCRQVQATRTKKSLTTKSLDNVITRTNRETKEKASISNRCADFTYEISRIFGVSRAILENVIFCTQEDSHWPLETDQKLKEKFDQIFDSDKYNKCVNKVREKRKKIRDVLKNSEIELKYLKENKTMAVEKKRRIEKIQIQIDSCNQDIQDLSTTLQEVENMLKEVNEKEMHMSKNHALKEMKKIELKTLDDSISELKIQIKNEYVGNIDELKNEVENFTKMLTERQKELVKEEAKIKQFNFDESKLSQNLMKEQGILGQLLKEEELNQERMNERNQLLNKLAADLKVGITSQINSQDFIQSLMKRVKAKIMDEEDKLAKLKLMLEEEEQDLQANIDKLKEESLMTQNDVSNKDKALKNCEVEINKIKKELNELDKSANKLSELEHELDVADRKLKELEESVNVNELKGLVKKSIEDRNSLEEKVLKIEENVKKLQEKSNLTTELVVQNDLKSNKDSQFRRLINKHEESLKGLLGEIPESGFKIAVQNHVEGARQRVKELELIRSKKEKELTELEMKRKHIKEKLHTKENSLRSSEEEVYDICGSSDFEDTISNTKKQIEDLQDVKGTLSSSEFMYQRYIRALQRTQPCCPLCHRDFEQESEASSLVEELQSKIREVPNRLQENKRQLDEKQNKYNKLLSLTSKYNQISVLKEKEIPEVCSELEKTETLLKKVQKDLNDIESEMYSPQADEAICTSLQGDMVLLDQLQVERKQLEKQIEKLQIQLGSENTSKDTLKKVLDELDATRQKLKFARQRVEEYQIKLNTFTEKLQLEQATKNSLMEQINKIQGGASQRQHLTKKLDMLGADKLMMSNDLEELRKKSESAKKKLEEIVSRKNMEKIANSEKIERMTYSVNVLLKQMNEIESSNKIIAAHDRKGIDERIEAVQSTMAKIENEIKSIKLEKENSIKKINEIKNILSNQEIRERELRDNLKLREKTGEAQNLRIEVAELEQKYGNTNFDAILKEKRKLKVKEEEIGKNKAQIRGRLVEMENQMKILEKELLSKTFKTVDEDYNKEYLKTEVLKAIGNDLDRYATTMEYAMMTYHKQQMTKVNSFIREYWRKIYQGNDIDYIEIQTDNIESTEKRRNYNYKIVQVKSDVHLDMRNRCSAGQKMLASLIIRLALAETFSSNCGILTLDEPTTNLDRKNIKNLARTLNEVLLAKQSASNPNFQLIVITHDEEFLQELMELDIVNEYVKVDRNPRGKTKVSSKILTGSELNLRQGNRLLQQNQYDYD